MDPESQVGYLYPTKDDARHNIDWNVVFVEGDMLAPEFRPLHQFTGQYVGVLGTFRKFAVNGTIVNTTRVTVMRDLGLDDCRFEPLDPENPCGPPRTEQNDR